MSEDDEHSSSSSSSSFSDYWQAQVGTALAQVFSLRITHNAGAEKFVVYGTVSVDHGMGTLHIYDKESDDECVHQGGTLSLLRITDFDRVIYATLGFTVYIDLKDQDGNEFIKGSFNVLHSDIKFSKPDKCQVKDVQGIMGVATICYAPLKVARPFCIHADFKLSRSVSIKQHVEVYGRLVAWYAKRFCYGENVSKEHCRVVLFDKEREEAVEVHRDQAGTWTVLLEDFHLAAPLYAPLVVHVDFRCVGADGHVERFEDQFEMPPNYIQTMKRKIKRNCGRIEVCVDCGPFIKPPIVEPPIDF